MKKLSLILASALFIGGISFASPVVKQDAKAPVAKQTAKSAPKATKATKGTAAKPAKAAAAPAKSMKPAVKPHPANSAPVQGTAK